jgi:hypothetical protein
VLARADGGGGLQWPESIVEATCMHMWAPWSSTRTGGGALHHQIWGGEV